MRAFASLGGAPSVEVVGLEEPWRYRNRAELTFGESDGRLILGYHAARSFWRIVGWDDCLLLPEPATRVLQDVRLLAEATGLRAYRPRTHEGFFRYALIRSSRATGAMLVCLMTAPGEPAVMEEMAQELTRRHPAVSSVYWGITSRVADVARPETLRLLRGSAHLEDQLGPFRLRMLPFNFLQPSTTQAHRVYERLRRLLELDAGGIAWDLYCGLGVAGFYLCAQFRRVYGIDVEAEHLELAQANAALNGLHNIEFRMGAVEAVLMDRRFWLQEAKPDVVVIDPPRAGLHPRAAASLLAARPRRIAYVSCNVESLARDLAVLGSGFPRYHVREVHAFDLFPQTPHFETLVLLERSDMRQA
jgi:23S rRNA (uracil1939-C5)-methyltransferase